MLWKTHLGKSNQFCDDGIADEISYLIVVHYCWLSQLTQLNFLSMTVWNKKFTNIFRNVFSLLHLAASSSDTFKYQSIPKQTQMPVFFQKEKLVYGAKYWKRWFPLNGNIFNRTRWMLLYYYYGEENCYQYSSFDAIFRATRGNFLHSAFSHSRNKKCDE